MQASFASLQKRLADTLGVPQDPSAVAAAIRKHPGEELEQMLVDAKCTVAIARTHEEWWPIPPDRPCMPSRSSTSRLV